jgi:ABC-type antimicrobial peptide transport system permease subunit
MYIRAHGDPMDLIPLLRREVLAIDPRAAAFHALLLSEETSASLLTQKVAAGLLTALALMALILAAVGLYSVMSYSVGRRTQEFGVRMALGASQADILRSVFWGGLTLTVAGTAGGVLLALALTRTVSGMLVNVSAADPVAFAAAVLFVLPVTALASFIPAHRATRLSPVDALRSE